jgi:homopolymeric O-antigen transport system permease protein
MSVPVLVRYRWLLYEFTRRELANRYAGSLSGIAWTFLQPLAQLAIYAVIFTQVFRATVPAQYPGVTYTAFVAVALWPWIMFSEAVQRGMVAITANAGLIRKVALPNQLFVFSAVIACFAIHLAGFLVVLAVLASVGENVRLAGVPFALLLLAPYLLLAAGVALILAALQTLLKDVEHGTGIVLSILFYATPILYPLSLAPAAWRGFMLWNPLASLSERLRDVLIVHPSLVPGDLVLWAVSIAVFAAGLAIFKRLAPYFEDFL